jgi:hypothetical protein
MEFHTGRMDLPDEFWSASYVPWRARMQLIRAVCCVLGARPSCALAAKFYTPRMKCHTGRLSSVVASADVPFLCTHFIRPVCSSYGSYEFLQLSNVEYWLRVGSYLHLIRAICLFFHNSFLIRPVWMSIRGGRMRSFPQHLYSDQLVLFLLQSLHLFHSFDWITPSWLQPCLYLKLHNDSVVIQFKVMKYKVNTWFSM